MPRPPLEPTNCVGQSVRRKWRSTPWAPCWAPGFMRERPGAALGSPKSRSPTRRLRSCQTWDQIVKLKHEPTCRRRYSVNARSSSLVSSRSLKIKWAARSAIEPAHDVGARWTFPFHARWSQQHDHLACLDLQVDPTQSAYFNAANIRPGQRLCGENRLRHEAASL